MRFLLFLCTTAVLVFSSGCGTFTGLPGHGGGKRFAIEQELISASTRAVARDLRLEKLKGKNCALFVNVIGDEGAGNLTGGRYSWETSLRGQYVNSPAVETSNQFPVIDTTSTSTTGSTQTVTQSENALNYPSESRQTSDGATQQYNAGMTQSWPPAYRAEAFINPNDSLFLKAVLHELFTLRGIRVVQPQYANISVYITVDVFGTIRQRMDWQIYNQERLSAKTALQISAFDAEGGCVLAPQTSSYRAEYIERYILWMGPFDTQRRIRKGEPLLVDFTDIAVDGGIDNGVLAPPPQKETTQEKTRTKPRTTPLPAPDPFRPEDVKDYELHRK
jgi:putative component of membrane protein insertase Oxa1/YidC/SpoIIIJ protein YidD